MFSLLVLILGPPYLLTWFAALGTLYGILVGYRVRRGVLRWMHYLLAAGFSVLMFRMLYVSIRLTLGLFWSPDW